MIHLQIDELTGTIQTYRVTINEKDAKLNELQTKLENSVVDQREQELFKQIADYKEKNNVSAAHFVLSMSLTSFSTLPLPPPHFLFRVVVFFLLHFSSVSFHVSYVFDLFWKWCCVVSFPFCVSLSLVSSHINMIVLLSIFFFFFLKKILFALVFVPMLSCIHNIHHVLLYVYGVNMSENSVEKTWLLWLLWSIRSATNR